MAGSPPKFRMQRDTHPRLGGCQWRARVATLYGLFALIATATNLVAQEFVHLLTVSLAASILAGTVTGFLVKYLLDKRWAFDDDFGPAIQEMRKITLYGIFSVGTTLLFWATEVAFWMVWQSDLAKYTGAAIGLAIGYAVKFALDSSFVFRRQGT